MTRVTEAGPLRAVYLPDRFSATIGLRVAQPQPQLGLIQLNATRGASNELISCDVDLADFLAALTKVLGVVVLDPEDREQVERLESELARRCGWLVRDAGINVSRRAALQAALREFANPTPPIIEPTGLGAVVEGSDGRHWVRIDRDGGAAKWLLVNAPADTDPRYVWSAVNAVRVLSEGVPA